MLLKDLINTLESNLIKAGYWDDKKSNWLAYNEAGLFFKTKVDSILKELASEYNFEYDTVCEKAFESKVCNIYVLSISITILTLCDGIKTKSLLYFAFY